MHVYLNEEGVLCALTEIQLLLDQNALDKIKDKAICGDEMALLIVSGIKTKEETTENDEESEIWDDEDYD